MAEITKDDVLNWLDQRTVLELSELTKELEDRWGVTAAAAVAAVPAAGGAAAGGDADGGADQTEFTAVLKGFGDKKIQVIKEIRAITGLGLKEAKELVEGVPSNIKENVEKEEAEEIKKKIEAAGGEVEIK